MESSSFKYKWAYSLVNTLNNIMWNNEWIKGEDYPAWGNTDVYKKTISGGYLFDGETPREAYQRVAKTVARRLYKPEMAETFFNYLEILNYIINTNSIKYWMWSLLLPCALPLFTA